MNSMRKFGYSLVFGLLFTIAMFFHIEHTAIASGVVLPDEYFFVINGQQKPAGTEFELKSPETLLSITADAWDPGTTVQWVTSEPGVVAVEATTIGTNYTKLVRKGPGYSTITAIISQGSNSYSLSCLVKVDLLFDYQKTGITVATTTKERILVLNNLNDVKQVYLKYIDYEDAEGVAVSGAAISLSAVSWESDNEEVATVTADGKVTAVGSGTALITVTSNTMSSQNRTLSTTMLVVVKPTFSITYDDLSGTTQTVHSVDNVNSSDADYIVPADFTIVSNAGLAGNLKWEVYDFSTGKKLDPNGTKLKYSVSTISGNVTFSNVKAGTYDIYAFANDKFNTGTNAPYAYMKIIVPIDIGDRNLVMTVGDTYNIANNSNIPNVNIFTYIEENSGIASIDRKTGIISAKRKGTTTIRLVYQDVTNLFDNATIVDDIIINITVIDGIALNLTNANIYTSGTIMLNAIVTDPTKLITWSSSNPSIATVDADGLVTGVKAGIVTITAQQTINGVIKKATCQVTVQQSVATIVINPDNITLPIGGMQTLHATITPSSLSGVQLTWRSSDNNVVTIIENNNYTATVQGVSGGNAVISAINQNNVVVGYCHVRVQQPVTSVVLSETEVTVDLSLRRLQLRATAYPENAMDKTIRWTTSDAAKARVDNNGLVTLQSPGTVTIIATSVDNPTATAMCNINIQIPVVSVALDEATKTMYVGQSARLTYTVLPVNASKSSVTWTSTNTSVVTVDNTGKVTAKGVGTAVIILKAIDGGHSVYCTITVKQIATGVKFDVTELDLKSGEYYIIKPAFTPKNSTENSLIWESSDTKIAIVDGNGKVSAKEAGTAIIMARTDSGAVAYCKVNVTQPVKGLILNYSEKTIYVGNEFELKVSVTPSEASELGVIWESSRPEVATIDKKGIVNGLTGGTTVITAKTVDGGYTAACVVIVRELVTSIQLNHESYRLGLGSSFTLTATVTNQTATNQNVTWKSSNEKVATVSKKGKVTGHALGYATITAIAQDGSEVEAECEVQIVKPVTRVTLNKTYLTMFVGETKQLQASVEPKNATYNKASFTSSDDKIAIVDEDGYVTAFKAGIVTITANAQDDSGKRSICYITVNERIPSTGITTMDKKLTMVPGEEKMVQVSLSPANSTDSYIWSTDNSAVVNVNKTTGKITAKATGTAVVTVMTDSGRKASIEITVIGLNYTELTLEQYTTYNYPLTVEGATTAVSWSIDNPEVAVLRSGRNSAVISSRAIGTATITATVNGRKLKCKLKVTKIS